MNYTTCSFCFQKIRLKATYPLQIMKQDKDYLHFSPCKRDFVLNSYRYFWLYEKWIIKLSRWFLNRIFGCVYTCFILTTFYPWLVCLFFFVGFISHSPLNLFKIIKYFAYGNFHILLYLLKIKYKPFPFV